VDPLREYCPRCGTRTKSSLSQERPLRAAGERSPAELQRNRKTVLIVAGGIAAMLVVFKGLPWAGHGIHIDIDDDDRKGAVVTTANDFAKAFADDPAAAEKKFRKREITVSGEFLRLVPDGYGSLDMRLKTPNPDVPLGADLVGATIDDAKKLRPGQQVTVSCRKVAGAGNERWLQECAIQSTGDAAPAPPTPTPAPAPPKPPSAPANP
jgi:hypothetical protein